MRNTQKAAERGRKIITQKRDLTVFEIDQLTERIGITRANESGWTVNGDQLFSLVSECFYFGVAVGHDQATSSGDTEQNEKGASV